MDEDLVVGTSNEEGMGTSLNKMDENVTDVGNDDSASGRSSPDANCPICLGRLENKSFTDSCLHQFCFNCLEQWSRVKAECPLCKQTFKSIIHNIRSIEDFEEHVVQNDPEPLLTITYSDSFYPQNFPPREPFRYRTTAVSSYLDYFLRLEQAIQDHVLPPMPPPGLLTAGTQWQRRRHVGTSDFRRSVYQHGLWVQGMRDVPRQYRESSPEFYRLNPTMVHRLVPWLNRELNVLCGGHDTAVQTAMTRILELIIQVPICSAEFRAGVSEYIGRHTEHFVHEFHSFARSALDMIGYDRHASYVNQPHLVCPPAVPVTDLAADDDDDSDVLIVGPESSPAVSIHIESDSDECVVVDSVPAPSRARSPEVITLESDDDVVQVNIHIPGPSRLRRPPLNRNWLTVKNVKSINENVNVSINIGHSSRSRSRSTSLSSSSSSESWTPRRKKLTKAKSKKKEKKVKERKERKDSKDSKSSKESIKKLKLKRVTPSCPKKAALYRVLDNDSDESPIVSPRRWKRSAVLHSSSSDNEEDKDGTAPNREQYSSSDESEYKPRLRSVVIKTEPQPSTSSSGSYSTVCKTEDFKDDNVASTSYNSSPFYNLPSAVDTGTSGASNLSKASCSRRRSYSTSSSECPVSRKNKHSDKRMKRNAYW